MDRTQKDTHKRQDKTDENRDVIRISIHYNGAKNYALLL